MHLLLLILLILGVSAYGVITTQSALVSYEARIAAKTPSALASARKAVLEYATAQGAAPHLTQFGHLPRVDFFDFGSDAGLGDDRFIVSRPGQLPCPDLLGASSTVTVATWRSPALRGINDGRLDGVADYYDNLCVGTTTNELFAAGSRLGKLPWREYYDYTNFIRAFDRGDESVDGSGDRLLYAVAEPLVNPSRPINPYILDGTQASDWLSVSVTLHTGSSSSTLHLNPSLQISNIAAVVLSPGRANADQQARLPEADLLSPGTLLTGIAASVYSTLYLEGENSDGDNEFTHAIGVLPQSTDQIAYIHRDEIIESLQHPRLNDQLDSLADMLDSYHRNYGHMPSPVSSDEANDSHLANRLGRPAEHVNYNFYSQDFTGTPSAAVANLPLQGGRVSYGFNPADVQGGTVRAAPVFDNQIHYRVPGSLAPNVIAPIFRSNTLIQPGDDAHNVLSPPFGEALIAGADQAQLARRANRSQWEIVVPAGTPMVAAAPFYAIEETGFVAAVPTVNTGINITMTLGHRLAGMPGSNFSPPVNAAFADAQLESLGNLSRLGYGVWMPAGTWLVAPHDYTVRGAPESFELNGRYVEPRVGAQFAPVLNRVEALPVGVITHHTNEPARETALPDKSPLVPTGKGLLPVPLFPKQAQQPVAATLFDEQINLVSTFMSPTPVAHQGTDIVLVTDPAGAIGSYPTEVTLHPQIRIARSAGPSVALQNRPFEIDFSRTLNSADLLARSAVVRPYPYSLQNVGGSPPSLPADLIVIGPIVAPPGTRFFYPYGTVMSIGLRNFSHNAQTSSPNPPVMSAHLPPGAVLHGVVLGRRNGNLPDGSQLAAGYVAPFDINTTGVGAILNNPVYVESVTLVNGGMMDYTNLGYYGNGVGGPPQTAVENSFRVDSSGLELVATVNVPPAFNPDEVTGRPLTTVSMANGFRLYPARGVVEVRSRQLRPVPSISRTDATVTIQFPVRNTLTVDLRELDYTAAGVTTTLVDFIDNPLGRADVNIYNAGELFRNIADEITLAANRAALTTAGLAYAFVDQRGVGIELQANPSAAVRLDQLPVYGDIVNFTLDYNIGANFIANPGMMYHDADATRGRDVLAMVQYGQGIYASPLVARAHPYSPIPAAGRITMAGPASTVTINATSAELAVHLDGRTTIGYHSDPTEAPTAPHDRVVLGQQGLSLTLVHGGGQLRTFARFHTDAILGEIPELYSATASPARNEIVPAGSQAEFGMLEIVERSAAGRRHHFVRGGRVFDGVGHYPLPAASAIRMFGNIASFQNPESITVVVMSAPADTTLTIPQQTVQLTSATNPFGVGTFILTTDITSAAEGALAVTADMSLVLTEPQLLLPGGIDIDPLRRFRGATLDYFLIDPDLSIKSSSITVVGTGQVYSHAILRDLAALSVTLGIPVHDSNDMRDLEFAFFASTNGAVNGPSHTDRLHHLALYDEIEDSYPVDDIQAGQLIRMRLVPDEYIDTRPNLRAMTELSWSGTGDDLGFASYEPEALVFAQNNPVHYFVAPGCHDQATRSFNECSETEVHNDSNAEIGAYSPGLTVHAVAGERVRLPSAEHAPEGLVVHGYRREDQPPGNVAILSMTLAGGVTTYQTLTTAAGVRMGLDGEVFLLDLDAGDPFLLSEFDPPVSYGASDAGTTLLLRGVSDDGLMFRYEPTASATYPAGVPAGDELAGYQGTLTVVVGGFTDRPRIALHQIVMPFDTSITLGANSTLFANSGRRGANRLPVIFGPGSGYAARSLDGYVADSWSSPMSLQFLTDAYLHYGARRSPQLLPGLTRLTLNDHGAFTDAGGLRNFGNLEIVSGGETREIVLTTTGQAMQGLLSGLDMSVHAVNHDATDSTRLLARSYNKFQEPLVTVDGGVTTTLRPVGYDVGLPMDPFTPAASLTTYEELTITLVGATLEAFDPPSPASCWVCSPDDDTRATVNVRAQATNIRPFFTANPIHGWRGGTDLVLTTHEYNRFVTVHVPFNSHVSFQSWLPDSNIRGFRPLTGISVGITGTLALQVDVWGNPSQTNLPTRNAVRIHTRQTISLTVKGFDPSFDYGAFQQDFIVPPEYLISVYVDKTLSFYAAPTLISPAATVPLGRLSPHAIAVFDRFAADAEPITVTLGLGAGSKPVLSGPIALMSDPAASSLAAFAPVIAPPPPVPPAGVLPFGDASDEDVSVRADSQLYTDNPNLELSISADSGIALQLVERNMTLTFGSPIFPPITRIPIYEGSVLYPNLGNIFRARVFELPSDFILTLGPNGAVANIVGGGGAGRAIPYTRQAIHVQRPEDVPPQAFDPDIPFPTHGLFDYGYVQLDYRIHRFADTRAIGTDHTNVRTPAHAIDMEVLYSHPTVRVLDLETRQMDAVLVDPAVTTDNAGFKRNYVEDPSRLNLPAFHRIVFGGNAEIPINIHYSRPASSVTLDEFIFPANTSLTLPQLGRAYDLEGLMVPKELIRTSLRLQRGDFTFALRPPMVPPENERMFLPYPLTLDRPETIPSSVLTTALRQNMWIRINDQLTVAGATSTVVLDKDTVINPFLGTFLHPPVFREPVRYSFLRTQGQALLQFRDEAGGFPVFATRPAMILPAGITMAVGSGTLSFEDVRGLLVYSPRSLYAEIDCASLSGDSFKFAQDSRARNTVLRNEIVYGAPSAEFAAGSPGDTRLPTQTLFDDGSFSYAQPCQMIDLPENSDGDNEFIHSSGRFFDADGNVTSNDRMRMIGGRIVRP